jgi:transposase InsO family protein
VHKSKHANQKLQQQTQMETLILHTFWAHHRRYGVRRIVAELQQQGVKASKHTVQKVLHHYGLTAIQPRSFVPRTTQSRHPYTISPNLLLDQAFPRAPNQVWVGDITYLPLTGGGVLYLAVWMDLFSRLIVGWHLEAHMREVLVLQALKNALQKRSIPNALILHSDRGGQYAGKSFRSLLAAYRIRQSMSRADNVYDNAFMEALFSRFKAELLQGGVFLNKQDAGTEIFEYIEMYYNTQRRHSALGYQSPLNYENSYHNSRT